MSQGIGLAAAAYAAERLPDWNALAEKLDRWVRAAKTEGAEVLVLPEYAGMEAALTGATPDLDAAGWCHRAADRAQDYADLFARLAGEHGLWLLSGSLPAPHDTGRGTVLVNRAWLCPPSGQPEPVDKQILTPWERAHTPLAAGLPPAVFRTPFGRIGVLICYDVEFPALAQALACDILLVPACTETLAGQTRVRNAARARALEGQCIAVQAPLVGAVADCGVLDSNQGRAAIFAPPDHPFPDTGLLAQTAADVPGWAVARLAAQDIAETRRNGGVATLDHTDEAATRASLTSLRVIGQ